MIRLQNSPYFCVFKHPRAVKQKVWNEAENRERDWGERKNRMFCSLVYYEFLHIVCRATKGLSSMKYRVHESTEISFNISLFCYAKFYYVNRSCMF